MITKIKSLAAACLFAAVACTASVQAFPSHSMPYAAGYSLIVGTWQSRYGQELSISMDDVDGVPYSIHDVTNDGFTTVVRIILDDERHTMLTFSEQRDDGTVCRRHGFYAAKQLFSLTISIPSSIILDVL